MTWPTTFGNLLGGNQPLSLIDGMFQQTAQMLEVPCSASGATAISLTPLVNCPVLTGYTEFCAARFRAAANSAAGVTAQVNGLGFLPVYRADGVTQCGLNDLVLGFEYVVRFSQALGGGVGGWFLEAPAVGSAGGGGGTGAGIWTPGGRLTLQSGVPVMSTTQVAPQTIFYAPYVHPFVPIFNGSTVQMYQFTASQADTVGLSLPMGGSANWPVNSNFDVFVTLAAGVPILCTVGWTSTSSRATNLAIFGGFLTNATLATARTGASTITTLQPNQGTFLGTFNTTLTTGQSNWVFGGAGSGGAAAQFGLCNYHNKVLVNTLVIDSGPTYTYTSNVIRAARGSPGNAVNYVQSDSERAAIFSYSGSVQLVVAAGAFFHFGLGVNSITTFNNFGITQTSSAFALFGDQTVTYHVAGTGEMFVSAIEAGDNFNANTVQTNNLLFGSIWL